MDMHGRTPARQSPQRNAGLSRNFKARKLEIRDVRPLADGRHSAHAFAPDAAEARHEIKADPPVIARDTSRANLDGIAPDGTVVQWLGNIGPLAARR